MVFFCLLLYTFFVGVCVNCLALTRALSLERKHTHTHTQTHRQLSPPRTHFPHRICCHRDIWLAFKVFTNSPSSRIMKYYLRCYDYLWIEQQQKRERAKTETTWANYWCIIIRNIERWKNICGPDLLIHKLYFEKKQKKNKNLFACPGKPFQNGHPWDLKKFQRFYHFMFFDFA